MINTLTRHIETILPKLPFHKTLSQLYYNKIIDQEITLLNIKSTDKILFIGCGKYPLSAHCLHDKTQASIDVIDHNHQAIIHASHYFSVYNLDINAVCIDGADIDLNKYDHIIIAKQVVPKEKVVKSIVTRKRKHTSVSVRVAPQDRLPEPSRRMNIHRALIKSIYLYH